MDAGGRQVQDAAADRGRGRIGREQVRVREDYPGGRWVDGCWETRQGFGQEWAAGRKVRRGGRKSGGLGPGAFCVSTLLAGRGGMAAEGWPVLVCRSPSPAMAGLKAGPGSCPRHPGSCPRHPGSCPRPPKAVLVPRKLLSQPLAPSLPYTSPRRRSPLAVDGAPAGALHQHGHGVALVQHAQLALQAGMGARRPSTLSLWPLLACIPSSAGWAGRLRGGGPPASAPVHPPACPPRPPSPQNTHAPWGSSCRRGT